VLATDETWRNGNTQICDCCGQPRQSTCCMATLDGKPYAVYFASCYDHGGERESYIDVVFGTWGQGADYTDHITFGCRVGPVANSPMPAATAVNAAAVAPDGPLFGVELSREQALAHPRIADFWQMVDFITECDPLVHAHHYGHAPR
jgi:hypothetical protein